MPVLRTKGEIGTGLAPDATEELPKRQLCEGKFCFHEFVTSHRSLSGFLRRTRAENARLCSGPLRVPPAQAATGRAAVGVPYAVEDQDRGDECMAILAARDLNRPCAETVSVI
jgi:hypothetical protein